MKFLQKLKNLFTIKKFIGFISLVTASVILKYCIILYFPNISTQSLEYLYPVTFGTYLARLLSLEYYEHLMMGDKNMTNDNLKGSDKLFMDNTNNPGNASGSGIIRNEENRNAGNIADVVEPPVIAEFEYIKFKDTYDPTSRSKSPIPFPHPDERLSKLRELDRQGREKKLFAISNVNARISVCKVSYYKHSNDPSLLNEPGNMELLRGLWELFPHGGTEVIRIDDYLLHGRVYHNVADAVGHDDWPYKCDWNRNGRSSWFEPNHEKGYYQPWATDIANAMDKFKNNRGTGLSRPILDPHSTVFLTTFQNHLGTTSNLAASRALRKL